MAADSVDEETEFLYEEDEGSVMASSEDPPHSALPPPPPSRVISLRGLRDIERIWAERFDALSAAGAFGLEEVAIIGRSCRLRLTLGPFRVRLTLRTGQHSMAAEDGSVDVREEDVVSEGGGALYERSFACFLAHVLRFVCTEGMEPPRGGLAAAAAQMVQSRASTQVHALRAEVSAAEGAAAAAAAAEALVARLRPLCQPASAALRVLLAAAYARDHFAEHCAVCGRLRDESAAAGGGGGGGAAAALAPPGAPALCGGDFCRYRQLLLLPHVDLFTELQLNGGLQLQAVLALHALCLAGERRFAVLHPVPEAFLVDAGAAELAAMGPLERAFAGACARPQRIDYGALRSGLMHLVTTEDFQALAALRSNGEVAARFVERALARAGVRARGLAAARATLKGALDAPFSVGWSLAELLEKDEGGGARALDADAAAAPPPPQLGRLDAEYLLLWWVATALPFRFNRVPGDAAGLPQGVPEEAAGVPAGARVYELTPRAARAARAMGSDAELGPEIAAPAAGRSRWAGAQQQAKPLAAAAYHFHGSNTGNWFSMLRNGVYIASGTFLMSAGAALGSGACAFWGAPTPPPPPPPTAAPTNQRRRAVHAAHINLTPNRLWPRVRYEPRLRGDKRHQPPLSGGDRVRGGARGGARRGHGSRRGRRRWGGGGRRDAGGGVFSHFSPAHHRSHREAGPRH
jgi:hypothetical protein